MARYVATAQGFIGRRFYEPGESFEFDGKPGSWMVPAESYDPPEPPASLTPEARTLSEMQTARPVSAVDHVLGRGQKGGRASDRKVI